MSEVNKSRFDLSQIGEADRLNLSATFLDAIQRFYDNPANIERFEAWQRAKKGSGDRVENPRR